MAANFLKFIDKMTELLLIGHPKRLVKVINFEFLLGNVNIKLPPCARIFGVYLDCSRSFKAFIQRLLPLQFIASASVLLLLLVTISPGKLTVAYATPW